MRGAGFGLVALEAQRSQMPIRLCWAGALYLQEQVVRKPKSTARRIVNTDLAGDLDMSKNCNPDPGARTCDRATTSCALDLALETNRLL